MTDTTELLPCPFCGGEGEMVEAKEAGPQAYVICCKKCLCSSRVIFALMDDVANDLISAWNTRTDLIPAMLAEARAKGIREAVQIKPLTWYDIPEGQDCRIGRCGQTAYSVRFKRGHWGYSRSGYAGHIVSGKGAPYFTTEKEAMEGADRDHRERILEALLDQHAETEGVTVHDYGFLSLIRDGMAEGDKAMRNFPQPNYVISKFAEESGEVVKAAIHCAEGRETPENVLGEMRQVIAMMYRLWVEGDQVHALHALSGDRHE